jgi:hypothetical protein
VTAKAHHAMSAGKLVGKVSGDGVLDGKRCYGHLGGTLGVRLFERLIELGWFTQKEGTTTVYEVTDLGKVELGRLGVDVERGR